MMYLILRKRPRERDGVRGEVIEKTLLILEASVFVLFHHTRNFLEKRSSTSPKTITIMPILANTSRYPNDCVKEASLPANQLAIPEPANHTPISNDANLTGAIALTIDRPIGDKNSSPIVWNI